MLTLFSWVYLFFFNMLWVFLPLYALYQSYTSLTGTSPVDSVVETAKEVKKKKAT
jgi:hypothetical protein